MSKDEKLIILDTKKKVDSSVEDMVDDCVQLLADKKFSHGVTILFDEETRDLNILATTNLMKNSRDLIGMLEEVKLFLFRSNYE